MSGCSCIQGSGKASDQVTFEQTPWKEVRTIQIFGGRAFWAEGGPEVGLCLLGLRRSKEVGLVCLGGVAHVRRVLKHEARLLGALRFVLRI